MTRSSVIGYSMASDGNVGNMHPNAATLRSSISRVSSSSPSVMPPLAAVEYGPSGDNSASRPCFVLANSCDATSPPSLCSRQQNRMCHFEAGAANINSHHHTVNSASLLQSFAMCNELHTVIQATRAPSPASRRSAGMAATCGDASLLASARHDMALVIHTLR